MIDRKKAKIIYDASPKKDKVMFSRKLNELNDLLIKIKEFEEKICDLMAQKQPFVDELVALRASMVKICVHPKDFLEEVDNHIFCKFCNKNLQVNVKDER